MCVIVYTFQLMFTSGAPCTPLVVNACFLSPSHTAERMRLEMDCFYREVAVMMKVSTGAHPNVISMVGCIPEQPGPAIVMEYAPLGNLHAFLLKYKNKVGRCLAC